MAYPRNRNSYPRICELLTQAMGRTTGKPLGERIAGDERMEVDCGGEMEAKNLRYALYGWIDLLTKKGSEEEVRLANAAKRWKIVVEGEKVVCMERDNPEQLKSVMRKLMEKGML